jgi:hypothetical protein
MSCRIALKCLTLFEDRVLCLGVIHSIPATFVIILREAISIQNLDKAAAANKCVSTPAKLPPKTKA